MQLPRDEYLDEIELPAIAKLAVDGPRATRNPGSTALFTISIDGIGTYELYALGVNHEWSRYGSGPYESGMAIQFAVDVPADALSNNYADLVVKALDEETGELLLARIFVEVDDTDSHPNDAEQAVDVGVESKETPFPFVLPLLGYSTKALISPFTSPCFKYERP
jgi:hypothetical protein